MAWPVKRPIRFLWVLVVNGIVIRMMFTRLFGESFNRSAQTPEAWREFLLESTIPLAGIILELAGWKFARWANVGYLTLLGLFFCAEAVRWWSDPFHGVLLILGLGLLIAAGATELVYRWTLLN